MVKCAKVLHTPLCNPRADIYVYQTALSNLPSNYQGLDTDISDDDEEYDDDDEDIHNNVATNYSALPSTDELTHDQHDLFPPSPLRSSNPKQQPRTPNGHTQNGRNGANSPPRNGEYGVMDYEL